MTFLSEPGAAATGSCVVQARRTPSNENEFVHKGAQPGDRDSRHFEICVSH